MGRVAWVRKILTVVFGALITLTTAGVSNAGVTQAAALGTTSFKLVNGSFESGLGAWTRFTSGGSVSWSREGYYGQHSIDLQNTTTSHVELSQTVPLNSVGARGDLRGGVEASLWVGLTPDVVSNAKTTVQLEVDGILKNGQKVPLAKGQRDSTAPQGAWQYLLTKPCPGSNNRIMREVVKVVVSVKDDIAGDILVDFVQVGQLNSLTGNPTKFVIGEYQPWFGASPNWYHWGWTGAGTKHIPDRILANGRRDIAAHFYPLVGAYDSTDINLLRYQFDTMKAMGVDCILVDWYAGLVPAYNKTLDTLVRLADQTDMKISVFYEPKIHLLNWIPSTSRAEQLSSIVQDITGYLKNYQGHKSILEVRGQPVVGVFDANDTGLLSIDWQHIMEGVHRSGYNPFMVGDVVANYDIPSAFHGMMNWVIFAQELQWDNSYPTVESYSEVINRTTGAWVASDSAHRLGIGIVWPGFNDSGVDGWGGGSRVIPDSSSFYKATWDGVLKEGLNWVVIATFNDWNESTTIEPSIQFGYSRIITTSQYIAKFKGNVPVNPDVFPLYAREYDSTPPVTSATLTGTLANGRVYTSPVRIQLSAVDSKSGVAATYVSVDDGVTWGKYTKVIQVAAAGAYAVKFYSVDQLGNKEATGSTTFTIAGANK